MDTYTFLGRQGLTTTPIAVLFIILLCTWVLQRHIRSNPRNPPCLPERISYVSNMWQFFTNKAAFMRHTRDMLKSNPIVTCQMGPATMYFISGGDNITIFFRGSFSINPILAVMFGNLAGYEKADVAKLKADTSGSGAKPRPGHELPQERRIWHSLHRMYKDNLFNAYAASRMSWTFQQEFEHELSRSGLGIGKPGEWVEVRIVDFLKLHVSTAATNAVVGPRLLELNPGFIEAYWEYHDVFEGLAYGLPKWLNPGVEKRDKFASMCRRWYEDVAASEDSNWGSGFCRGLGRWAESFGFMPGTMGPVYGMMFFGLHGTSTPLTCWMILEILKCPALLQAVKSEAASCFVDGDPDKGFDARKLTSLPLMQSLFVETLRVYMGTIHTRVATEDVIMSGHMIPKGSMVQALSEVTHHDEKTWSVPGHPASEFWAYRHTKEIDVQDRNGSTERRLTHVPPASKSFSPFGGGISICPGRNLAKAEMLLVVAMIVTRFEVDMDSLEWLKRDGTPSDRPAETTDTFATVSASLPDRDLRLRWRRRF